MLLMFTMCSRIASNQRKKMVIGLQVTCNVQHRYVSTISRLQFSKHLVCSNKQKASFSYRCQNIELISTKWYMMCVKFWCGSFSTKRTYMRLLNGKKWCWPVCRRVWLHRRIWSVDTSTDTFWISELIGKTSLKVCKLKCTCILICLSTECVLTSSTLEAVLAEVSMNMRPCSLANASPSSFFTSLLDSRSL